MYERNLFCSDCRWLVLMSCSRGANSARWVKRGQFLTGTNSGLSTVHCQECFLLPQKFQFLRTVLYDFKATDYRGRGWLLVLTEVLSGQASSFCVVYKRK